MEPSPSYCILSGPLYTCRVRWSVFVFAFVVFFLATSSSGAGNLKARFENMARSSDEENRKRAEEERARRQAREKREQEEAKRRQQVLLRSR